MIKNCKQCGAPNQMASSFCYECGQSLQGNTTSTGDLLLLAFIGIHFFGFFIEFFFNTFLNDWYSNSSLRIVRGMTWAVTNLSFILPAAAIQNKNLRIIAMIIAGLIGVYYAYQNIKFAF